MADLLSRLPITNTNFRETDYGKQLNNIKLSDMPVTKKELQAETIKDKVLNKIVKYVLHSWPERKTSHWK